MAVISSDADIKWSVLSFGTPNVEFWFPADTPSTYVRLYHGVSNNTPNRRIIKKIRMGVSAGGVHNFRNVGYSDELIKLDIVLSTKEEANEFTSFFTDNVKGMSNVFYYRNNFTGQESIVRLMKDDISMGESEGHPYSFTLTMKRETPYSGNSLTLRYSIAQPVPSYPVVFAGHFGEFSHILMPTNSKTLHSTGKNNGGVLGTGDTYDKHRFTKIGTDIDWAFGGGGQYHAHAGKEDGRLYSAGSNSYGQLGVGDTWARNTFTQIGSDTWSKLDCGLQFTVAIKADGTLWAWGQNNWGQLGQGSYDFSSHPDPLQIGTDTDWVEIACGSGSCRAIKADGTLWVWGSDNMGQLGLGSTAARRLTLTQVGTDTDWSSVAAGYEHTLATKTDMTLWACGWNGKGCLGDGTTIDRYTLVPIGSSPWISIAAGGGGPGTSFGVKIDGTLWAWGTNANGELGIGGPDALDHPNPIMTSLSPSKVQVYARQTGGMAATQNGQVWTWGHNQFGDCGVNYGSVVNVPTRSVQVGNQVEYIWDVISAGPIIGPIPPPI